METTDIVIAEFKDHKAAEAAVKMLAEAKFETKDISVVGKGSHLDEKTAGFYTTGDRIEFYGLRGAFWGGLWGLFAGGLLMTVPVVGQVIVLGHLAALAITAIESGAVVGGLGALGSGLLYYLGAPEDSVNYYKQTIEDGNFLVMVHGIGDRITHAKEILDTANAARVDVHAGITPRQ